jgi:hypothetical protein
MSNGFKAAFQLWSTAGGPPPVGSSESALLFTRALRRVAVPGRSRDNMHRDDGQTPSGGVDVPQVTQVRVR